MAPKFYLACALAVGLALSASGATPPDAVIEALQLELSRTMAMLGEGAKEEGSEAEAPYFLGYEVTQKESFIVSASFGALTASEHNRRRYLDVDLRVGNYDFDNTRPLRGAPFAQRRSFSRLPLDEDVDALRSVVWNATDHHYKEAAQQLTKVRMDVEVKVDAEDQSADFSREQTVQDLRPIATLDADVAAWEEKVRRYSAPFAAHDDVYAARATIYASAETRWLVNSEGTRVRTGETRYRLLIDAQTIAEDGMALPRHESFAANGPGGLPEDEAVAKTVERMIADLGALREAPIVEPYAGPAILSGRAAGVFFHEVLGHRVEGHRQKREEEGQTFKKKVGEQVLPKGFDVLFDPTRRSAAGIDLVGAYDYDNQGVKAQPVVVVEDGVFENFLMSRTPIEGFPNSNGHGRKDIGRSPVARQSNLIVQVAAPLSAEDLKAELLATVQEQGKDYGLLFEDIQGGVTATGRDVPNAFNVQPILVYRVFPDGSEELVRGVDLIGTPLVALSRVVAADDQEVVFNGSCGAESGAVPVSATSPAILLSQIEVQKKRKSQTRPPILPPPA